MDNIEKALLIKEELKTLNKFIGFGDFSSDDIKILFWGLEEGAGPDQPYVTSAQRHRAEILLRIKYFGSNLSCCFNEINRDGGYWASGKDSDHWRGQCYQDEHLRFSNEQGKHSKRNYWNFTARMLCALKQGSEENLDNWFKKEGLSSECALEIDRCLESGIINTKQGVKAAFSDWRPILRENMSEWPFTGDIDPNLYLKAFDFEKQTNSDYVNFREERINIYKELFRRRHIPIVYCLGKKHRDIMTILIKSVFGDCPVKSRTEIIPYNDRTTSEMELLQVHLPSGITTIIYTNHFSNGGMSLKGLAYVTRRIFQILST